MSKKNLIIIISIIVIVLAVVGIYGTFASSNTVSNDGTTYNIILTNSTEEVVIPAGSSKNVIYQITNTNKGKVQYGIAYSGTGITVSVYSDAEDKASGLIDYGENKFIKLYISNNGSTESSATIKTILGYENGGSLDTLLPSGYSWVTDNPEVTPLSDFTYFLGSEYSTVDTIYHYDCILDEYHDIPVFPMTLQSNEVLLVKYKGDSKSVNVPDTYTVNGVTYNVVALSMVPNYFNEDDNSMFEVCDLGIFIGNTSIESVTLGKNIEFIVDSYGSVIENSMDSTFSGCTSLVNAPEIPNSVTDMIGTFSGCTSLVNAPEIPSSVTNMDYTFSRCTSLTGTVKINSSSVSGASYIFSNTTNAINVLVPSGSTTYTTFSKLTTSNGMPSNVTLSTY